MTSSDEKPRAPDGVLDAVQGLMGNFGRWQLVICAWISLLKLPVAWHQLGIVFLAPPAHFTCGVGNLTNHCPCDQPRYDRSLFKETIITEWNLICEHRQLANVAQLVFMFGVLLGNVVFGIVADRWGRKQPLVWAVLLQILAGAACAFVPWFDAFLALRFFLAFATGGTMTTSFVMCMEILGGRWRMVVSTLYHIPFSIGHILLAWIAYATREWHHFQLAISLPSIILMAYWIVIPESPRWLLAVGRSKEALPILKKAAVTNGIQVDSVEKVVEEAARAKEQQSSGCKQASFFDLFRTPNLRKKTLVMYWNWMVCGLCFFGLAQYMGQVGGDIFINVTISGVIEIPGALFCIYTMDRFGRRRTLMAGQFIAGAACLLIMAVPEEHEDWPRIMLSALGLVGMSVAFPTVYMYSGELFPTVLRNAGVGSSSTCARVGSMVAPFVTSLAVFGHFLPPMVFGVLPIVGGVLCFFLPETKGHELPDTVQDGEEFGKKLKEKPSGVINNGFTRDSPL